MYARTTTQGRKTVNWFLVALKKYAVFSGRARRKEYWMYMLFYLIIAIVLAIVDSMIMSSEGGIGILGAIFALGMLLPSIGVTVRRLHDTNRSGWWILISFVPFVGIFILLYFMIKEGDSGDNQYGADPKAAGA